MVEGGHPAETRKPRTVGGTESRELALENRPRLGEDGAGAQVRGNGTGTVRGGEGAKMLAGEEGADVLPAQPLQVPRAPDGYTEAHGGAGPAGTWAGEQSASRAGGLTLLQKTSGCWLGAGTAWVAAADKKRRPRRGPKRAAARNMAAG